MKRFLTNLATCVLLSLIAGGANSRSQPTGPIPGQFIVKLSKSANPARLAQALSDRDRLQKVSRLQVRRDLAGVEKFDRYYAYLDADRTASVADVVTALGSDNVELVEPDYYLELFDWPTDSLLGHQWYLHNTGQEYLGIVRVEGYYNDYQILKSGTSGKDVRITWQYDHPPAETTRVVVAIVDTGIDPTHPELQGRLWKNPGEIPGNGIDDDHNGFIDDTLGYDMSGDIPDLFNPVGDNDPVDHYGHGTHCAGIVAANNDGRGVVGIAPQATLIPVKMWPNASTAVGAAGIMYAVNAGAQVINISWGTPFESSILKEAIDFARHNGVLVCIASGNSGDNQRFFPAAFDSTFVVAAGNSDGYETWFSTYGAHVDIVAPGLDILSLRAAGTDMYGDPPANEPGVRIVGNDSLYYLSDGTSMAAPMVVGAAALMLSFRPDLTIEELQEILLYGATDLVDPLNQGDTLVGPDTISGFGYLNIDSSLFLLENGGLYIAEPRLRSRHIGDFAIKIASVAGYSGSWQLDYSVGLASEQWQFLSSGTSLPADSLAVIFSDPAVEGFINLRLTDKFGSTQITTVVRVTQNVTRIISPQSGEELDYSVPIHGSAYGPDFDSVVVFSRATDRSLEYLFSSTGEFFDSLMYTWSLSGADTGLFTVYLHGYFTSGQMVDSVSVQVKSAFANGWPQSLGDRGGMTAVCCDLNHDGTKEIIVGTRSGLLMFNGSDGSLMDGFPVNPGEDMRCVPAIHDVDGDGEDEIICTSDFGLHVYNYDGMNDTTDETWSRSCQTGMIPYEYAFPNPVIAQLDTLVIGAVPDSAIIFINKVGDIMAYRFDGNEYFGTHGRLFTSMDPRLTESYGIGGSYSPFVTAADLDGDTTNFEVVASYSSPYPYTGLAIFEGFNGLAADTSAASHVIETIRHVYGTVLADLDGDQLPEIVTAGQDSAGIPHLWAKDFTSARVAVDLPGWPLTLPDVAGWLGAYPTAADLDLDDSPEILITFFEYDIAALYIFRSDGSPYINRPGRPAGEAFLEPVTLGTPVVANLTGDEYPEIIMRSGYLLPGTGPERVYILDHTAQILPGWPIATPARSGHVFSSRYAPLIDDVDNDGLVELVLISDGIELLVWNFDASVEDGKNTGRFLMNNYNSNTLPPAGSSTGVDDDCQPELPVSLILYQNYPNPFNPGTVIRFELPTSAQVKLDVYNILGQKVTTLVERKLPSGPHQIWFDGTDYATGIYIYRLQTDQSVRTRKMLLVK
ncbi:MAG: S8 family peptidase [bacterium]